MNTAPKNDKMMNAGNVNLVKKNDNNYVTFLIKPIGNYANIAKEFYSNHNTFHDDDAGLDLFCLEDLVIPPRAYSVKMPFGISLEAYYDTNEITYYGYLGYKNVKPTGFYIYPRSSTGSKTPIRLANSVGIIDAGYRGEIVAILDNLSDEPFVMKKGERYFQICSPTLSPIKFHMVEQLSQTKRGEGGLGSTGV